MQDNGGFARNAASSLRNRAAACRIRHTADRRLTRVLPMAISGGGASSGSGEGFNSRSVPRLTKSRRSSDQSCERNSEGESTAALEPLRPRRPLPCRERTGSSPAQPQEIAMQCVESGMSFRPRRNQACSARRCDATRARRSTICISGNFERSPLRQKFRASLLDHFRQSGFMVGKEQERGWRRQTPAPETASASRAPAE